MTAFGSVFMPEMALARFEQGQWNDEGLVSSHALPLHPGAHVLHYSSTCFEGLKAFRHPDGSIQVFRLQDNIKRMVNSSRTLHLPEVDAELLSEMIKQTLQRFASEVPEPPGSMYIRPTHLGTDPIIGKAAAPSSISMLYVLLSPVGDYFAGGVKPLTLYLEEQELRCAPHMGVVKSGGNYASALDHILKAKAQHQADQVLFCPKGDVQETGAANFFLIDGNRLITKSLDSTFLHGITRASILTLAKDLGMEVEERALSLTELLERAGEPGNEAALSGTAAVLTPVGELVCSDRTLKVGSQDFPKTNRLRQALNQIQWGQAEDTHGWLTVVG